MSINPDEIILSRGYKNYSSIKWCERGDSNPHEETPLDPKSSASANSATFAWCQTLVILAQEPINVK